MAPGGRTTRLGIFAAELCWAPVVPEVPEVPEVPDFRSPLNRAASAIFAGRATADELSGADCSCAIEALPVTAAPASLIAGCELSECLVRIGFGAVSALT